MSHNLRIMVTGGCGFIGSAVCRYLASLGGDVAILNFDAMTYAASETSLADIQGNNAYSFVKGDVADAGAVAQAIAAFKPTHIMHLAAESHVDRSITGPGAFIQTNVIGTYVMLQAALDYWRTLDSAAAEAFRFHHISTDEVFGSLGAEGLFSETTPYDPRSPYSASKASSDHMVRAWHHTYGLPVVVSNCSNNYGPYHFPEKLIPLVTLNALEGKPLPVYGKGGNFVETMIKFGRERGALKVVADQVMSPTSSWDAAEAILDLIKVEAPAGVYHVVNSGAASWHDFASAIIDRAGVAATVSPIPTSEFPTPARRPPYSVLANGKVEKALGRSMPAWQDALDRYLTAKGHR